MNSSDIDDCDYNYGLSLSLILYGLSVHPDEATNILGIKPTSSRAIGETGTIIGTTMKINLAPSKYNIWAFSTTRVEDSEFEYHWEKLYEIIQGKESKFEKINELVDCVALSINIGVGKFVPGIEISSDILSVISRFKFRLDYDVIL